MDKKRLKELEDGQMEKLDKLFDDIVYRIKNKNEKIEPLDFYPEIKSQLTNKTYTNWLMRQKPILLQLPFYDSIIISLIPVKDEESFKKATGITISQTLELFKKEKVVPLLQFPPLDFEGLDYMDPILELDLPVINLRQPAYDQILSVYISGNDPYQIENWHRQGKEFFKKATMGKLTKYPKSLIDLVSKKAQYEDDLLNNIGYCYSRLHLMGYSDLAISLMSLKNPNAVARCIEIYEHILVGGEQMSLGGIVSWDSLDALAAKKLGIDTVKAFPIDVGKLLIKEFKLASVEDFGFEKTIQVTDQTSKARESLFNLDDAVAKRQQDKVMERSLALKETWKETNEIINSMQNLKQKISKNLPVSVGVVGGLLSSLELPGIIMTLLSVAGSKVIAKPLSEFILRLKKPNHVVSIFDLKKSQS